MKTLSLLLLSGALLMQGCSVKPQSVTSQEQFEWESSRFVRGQVDWIFDIRYSVPFDKNLEVVAALMHKDGATYSTQGFLAPKNLDLQRGDVVDLYIIDHSSYSTVAELLEYSETLPPHKRSQVLGVVCRAADEDCEINTSPQTTIGFGRKMRDANDYRGVTAEAKQTIYPHEIPTGTQLFSGNKYTSSYVRRGISMEYEEPPETQQQPHVDLCDASTVRSRLALASSVVLGPAAVLLSKSAKDCSGTGEQWDPKEEGLKEE